MGVLKNKLLNLPTNNNIKRRKRTLDEDTPTTTAKEPNDSLSESITPYSSTKVYNTSRIFTSRSTNHVTKTISTMTPTTAVIQQTTTVNIPSKITPRHDVINFSTPSYDISSSETITTKSAENKTKVANQRESSGSNSGAIAAGVIVPIIIIVIILVSLYIWYRKRYPVRMIIGKDFGIFTNPAYDKKTSSVTLERQTSFEKEYKRMTLQISEPLKGIDNPTLNIEDEHANYQPMFNPAYSGGMLSDMMESNNTYENTERSPVAPPRNKKKKAKVVIEPDEVRLSRTGSVSSSTSSTGSKHSNDYIGFKPLKNAPEVRRINDGNLKHKQNDESSSEIQSEKTKKFSTHRETDIKNEGHDPEVSNSDESILQNMMEKSENFVCTDEDDKEMTTDESEQNENHGDTSYNQTNHNMDNFGMEETDHDIQDKDQNEPREATQSVQLIQNGKLTLQSVCDSTTNESSTDDMQTDLECESSSHRSVVESNEFEKGVSFETVVNAVTFDPSSVSLPTHINHEHPSEKNIILAEKQDLKSESLEPKSRKISAFYGPLLSEKSVNFSDESDTEEMKLATSKFKGNTDLANKSVSFNSVVNEAIYDPTSVSRSNHMTGNADIIGHQKKELNIENTATRKISAFYGNIKRENVDDDEETDDSIKILNSEPDLAQKKVVTFQGMVDEVTYIQENEEPQGNLDENIVCQKELNINENDTKSRKVSEFYGGLLEESLERYVDECGKPAIRVKDESNDEFKENPTDKSTSENLSDQPRDHNLGDDINMLHSFNASSGNINVNSTGSSFDVTLDEQSFALTDTGLREHTDMHNIEGESINAQKQDDLEGIEASKEKGDQLYSFEIEGPNRKISTGSRKSSTGNTSDENSGELFIGPRRRVGISQSPLNLVGVTLPKSANIVQGKRVIGFIDNTKESDHSDSSDDDSSSSTSDSDGSQTHEYKISSDHLDSVFESNATDLLTNGNLQANPSMLNRTIDDPKKSADLSDSSADSDIMKEVENISSDESI